MDNTHFDHLEVRYVPDEEFVALVKTMAGVLTNVDGHMRWIITTEEGEKYALRPASAQPTDAQ